MLKIGEFARVGQVSIATLRHYDQRGLLKPLTLDTETSYRYYALDQLVRLYRILALRDLGFPLEQIGQILEEDLSLEQLQGMFRLKQAQTQRMIDIEQARLMRIATRLRQIEQEGKMPVYEIVLKQVDALLVASIRETIPIEDDRGRLYKKIAAYLDLQHVPHTEPDMLLFHSRHEWRGDNFSLDVEAAVPLPAVLPGNEQINIRTLPAGLMACTIHTGNNLSLGRAHAALHSWLKDNRYRMIGPPRHVHHQHTKDMDPGPYITELQFPVEKQER